MRLFVFICFHAILFHNVNGLVDRNMIDFLLGVVADKKLKFLQIYSCFSQFDKVELAKILSEKNVRSSFSSSVVQLKIRPLHYFLDVACGDLLNILKKYETINHFQSQYKWLLFDSQRKVLYEPLRIQTVLSGIHLRLDSEVLVAVQSPNMSKMLVYDVYSIGKNKLEPVRVSEIGVWTPATNLILIDKQSKYNRRKNLTGVFLKAGTVSINPLYNQSLDFAFRNLADRNSDTVNKMNYILFNHLQEIYQFTFNVTVENTWYGKDLGGRDAGLGKLLYENILDVIATVSLIKSDRIPYFDFIFPTYPFRSCFIFRNSRSSGTVDNEFLKPFSSMLWYAILITVGLFCVVLKFLFAAGHGVYDEHDEGWHSAFILSWGVICQQGASFVPKLTSGRCALLSMFILSLLLYNYYTSSIVSSLLSGLPKPIKTIGELTRSKLGIGMEDVPYVKILFEVTTDPDLQKFYREKVILHNEQPYLSVSDGLKRVQKGGYGYHTESQLSYSIIEKSFEPHQICELAEINLFSPSVCWVFGKKHGEFAKLFAVGYNKMLESGIIKRQQLLWITRKPACLKNAHLLKVGFDHLVCAFIVISLGIGFALLALLAELYAYKCKMKRNVIRFLK